MERIIMSDNDLLRFLENARILDCEFIGEEGIELNIIKGNKCYAVIFRATAPDGRDGVIEWEVWEE